MFFELNKTYYTVTPNKSDPALNPSCGNYKLGKYGLT